MSLQWKYIDNSNSKSVPVASLSHEHGPTILYVYVAPDYHFVVPAVYYSFIGSIHVPFSEEEATLKEKFGLDYKEKLSSEDIETERLKIACKIIEDYFVENYEDHTPSEE